jgi:formylglycine-generating enzyme required for sulfatase activity
MLKKRARHRDAISILLALLILSFACNSGKTGTTSSTPAKNTFPPLKSFTFDTVTLDASGKMTDRRSIQAKSYTEDLGGGVQLEMVLIPAGTFQMGSPASEGERLETEGPQHSVRVPEFYIGKFEVAQAQWRAIASLPKVDRELNPDPSHFKGDNLPVEQVSWSEAVEFCKRLSKKAERVYRLPCEAEWEYAARASLSGPFAFGETITSDIVNYNGDYPYAGASKGMNRKATVAVGSLGFADAFGLYDMQGNVEEWCLDNWHDNYVGAPTDGSAWTSGGDPEYQVLRGGSWYSSANYCRSSERNWLGTDYRFSGVGFRVVATEPSSTNSSLMLNRYRKPERKPQSC